MTKLEEEYEAAGLTLMGKVTRGNVHGAIDSSIIDDKYSYIHVSFGIWLERRQVATPQKRACLQERIEESLTERLNRLAGRGAFIPFGLPCADPDLTGYMMEAMRTGKSRQVKIEDLPKEGCALALVELNLFLRNEALDDEDLVQRSLDDIFCKW